MNVSFDSVKKNVTAIANQRTLKLYTTYKKPPTNYQPTVYPSTSDRFNPSHILPLSKYKNKLQFEIAHSDTTIIEIQRFRAKVFGEAYQIYFDNAVDKDKYDQYSIHVLVRDTYSGSIVACTRIITPEAKAVLGTYLSESEFDLNEYLQGKSSVYEIGRTCVDTRYRGGKALAVLWAGMIPLLFTQLKAKYIIGCVSLNLGAPIHKIQATEKYLHHKAKTELINSMAPYLALDGLTNNSSFLPGRKGYKKKDVPSLFIKYRRMGALFSKAGYHDKAFNCVDYFSAIKVTKRLAFKVTLLCNVMSLKAKH